MWAYIVRRCIVGIGLLLAMTLVTFTLFFATPIDAARLACGKKCSQPQIDETEKALGYDKSVPEQWVAFMKGLAVGRDFPNDKEMREAAPKGVTHCPRPCLGYSTLKGTTVNKLIAEAAPVSASLAVAALVMWLIGGVLFGVMAAIFKGSFIDRFLVGITLVAYAFPTFVIGTIFLKFVVIKYGWLDYPYYYPWSEYGLVWWLRGLFLPSFTLALVFMAAYVRMTRAFVLESLGEDYIRTARAKGLPTRTVLFKHGLRAALTPLVTMTGLDFAGLLGGALITEYIFTYRGLGLLTIQANAAFDLPVIVGVVLVAGTAVIIANIIVDVSYALIDPRVRLG